MAKKPVTKKSTVAKARAKNPAKVFTAEEKAAAAKAHQKRSVGAPAVADPAAAAAAVKPNKNSSAPTASAVKTPAVVAAPTAAVKTPVVVEEAKSLYTGPKLGNTYSGESRSQKTEHYFKKNKTEMTVNDVKQPATAEYVNKATGTTSFGVRTKGQKTFQYATHINDADAGKLGFKDIWSKTKEVAHKDASMIEKAKTKTAVFNKGATTGVKAAVYGGAAVAGLALAGGVVSAVRGGKKRENERRSRY